MIDFKICKVVFAKDIVVSTSMISRLRLNSSRFLSDVFEESKENKLEYTSLFQEYTNTIETMIEDRLRERIPVS